MLSHPGATIALMDASRVIAVAEGQHGAISTTQLRRLGLSPKQIHRLIGDGWLVPGRPGVFVVGGGPRTWHQAVMAAVLAAGAGAVASHSTAAVLWGLPGVERDTTEVSTARPDRRRLAGVRSHRTLAFLDCEHTTRHRIPVTTVARTIVDLSGRFSVPRLGRMTDHGLRKGTLRIGDLRRCVAALAPAPGRHPNKVHRVLRRRLRGYEPGDSDLEMRFVRTLVAAGLPEPVQQHRVILGARRCRIDLAYPDLMLAIEVDGWEHHRSRTTFDEDRARANDLVVAGWNVLRFTSTMTNEQAIETVAAALDQLGRSRAV
jgi:very-short-patch-repair endonuclease